MWIACGDCRKTLDVGQPRYERFRDTGIKFRGSFGPSGRDDSVVIGCPPSRRYISLLSLVIDINIENSQDVILVVAEPQGRGSREAV